MPYGYGASSSYARESAAQSNRFGGGGNRSTTTRTRPTPTKTKKKPLGNLFFILIKFWYPIFMSY